MAIVSLLYISPAFGFPWDSAPKNEIAWSDNLRQAQELSRQTGKPVLLHFFSDTCPPCKMMEKSTFPNPAIVAAIQKSFIPVKLNVRDNSREAQMFNVQSVPMDIVLLPDGQQIQASIGGQDANRYGHFLATAQSAAKQHMAKQNGQVGIANVSGQRVNQDPPAQNEQPFVIEPDKIDESIQLMPDFPELPTPETPLPDNLVMSASPKIEAGGACPINETPSFDYASIPEEDKARIEFEGYCPVELGLHSMWVRGDYNNRLQFEGRLYLFAGKAQLEEFNRNPEKYAPAYQGLDIVIWKERGEKVHGVRNYGAWAVGRVFLFSSEDNLVKFEKNARYYITPGKR